MAAPTVDNATHVLILQHPQEQDRELGTARLALRHFARGKLAVGLSWPNLAKALGKPADPKRWGVLYLGSAKIEASEEGELAALDRDELIGRRLRSLAEALCDGSMTPLLIHLARATDLTVEDRLALRAIIDEAEEEPPDSRPSKAAHSRRRSSSHGGRVGPAR